MLTRQAAALSYSNTGKNPEHPLGCNDEGHPNHRLAGLPRVHFPPFSFVLPLVHAKTPYWPGYVMELRDFLFVCSGFSLFKQFRVAFVCCCAVPGGRTCQCLECWEQTLGGSSVGVGLKHKRTNERTSREPSRVESSRISPLPSPSSPSPFHVAVVHPSVDRHREVTVGIDIS